MLRFTILFFFSVPVCQRTRRLTFCWIDLSAGASMEANEANEMEETKEAKEGITKGTLP